MAGRPFAHLATEIISDVLRPCSRQDVKNLLEHVEGTWGIVARRVQDPLRTKIASAEDLRVAFAPEILFEELKLRDAGSWGASEAAVEYFNALPARFSALELEFRGAVPAHVRDFLVRNLRSKHLRRLKCEVTEDLRIDDDLIAFCTSDQFERLEWTRPLSEQIPAAILSDWKTRNRTLNVLPRCFNLPILIGDFNALKRSLKTEITPGGTTHWKREFNATNRSQAIELFVLTGSQTSHVVYAFLMSHNKGRKRHLRIPDASTSAELRKKMYKKGLNAD